MDRRGVAGSIAKICAGSGIAIILAAVSLPSGSPFFDRLIIAGMAMIFIGVIGLAGLFIFQPKEKAMTNKTDPSADEEEWGNHNTILGKVTAPKRMGHGNTIVGATDDRGNTIITSPTTVGHGAQGSAGSVTIGAFASTVAPPPKKADDKKN